LVDCNISDRILDFDSVHSSIKEILMLKIFWCWRIYWRYRYYGYK
jgi:hypothetical protein